MMALGGKTLLQRLRTAAGMGPPITTFASLPPAASVPGQVRMISDVNNIELISKGGTWRPRGPQVLASKQGAPVTVQSLTETIIEATQTFPGGLVLPNMGLRIGMLGEYPGIGTGGRIVRGRLGPPGTELTNSAWPYSPNSTSSANASYNVELISHIMSGINHYANRSATGGYYSFNSGSAKYFGPDFAADWTCAFTGVSDAETAQTAVTATWAAGVATFTKTAHGYAVGDKIVNTLFTPTGYNGTLIVASVPTADTWTAAIAADPGGAGTGGSTSRVSNVSLMGYSIILDEF